MPKAKAKIAYEKDFLEAFTRQLLLAKEQSARGKEKAEMEKEKSEVVKALEAERARERKEKIIEIEKRLRPSIIKTAERKEMRAKMKEISIEKEAAVVEEKIEKEMAKGPIPKPTPSAMIAPPAPAVPMPPKVPAALGVPTAPVYRKGVMPVPAPPSPKKEMAEIRPAAIATAIDLGKLNPLIQDVSVSLIQCDGADTPIKIVKQGKLSETIISMTETEINGIIKRFADRANQVITEPVFKTQIGNLALTAIISSFTGSRFVISKI